MEGEGGERVRPGAHDDGHEQDRPDGHCPGQQVTLCGSYNCNNSCEEQQPMLENIFAAPGYVLCLFIIEFRLVSGF